MNHRMRLGPIAVFLCVTVMIMTTIAVLNISTSGADLVMAEKYAAVTKIRYRLDADGEKFLSDVSDAASSGGGISEIPGVSAVSDGYVFEKSRNGYKLEIEISDPGETGSFDVRTYRISRMWESDDPAGDIWKGN